jgi:hypothetical protein
MSKFRVNTHDHNGLNIHVLVFMDDDDVPLKLYHEEFVALGGTGAVCSAFEIDRDELEAALDRAWDRVEHYRSIGVLS